MKKKITVASIVQFMSIVTLKKTNRKGEMSLHISLEVDKHGVHVRFETKRKSPYEMRVVIHDYKIEFKSRDTRDRGLP